MEGIESMTSGQVLDILLATTYADGAQFELDLTPLSKGHARLADPAVFATAKISEAGATVAWANDDDLELAADNLRARAIDQASGVSHEFIWNWMHKHELSLDAAALALGLSRRMLAYYRSGEKTVPLTVGLACLGWEKAQAKSGKSSFGPFSLVD
ncbi:MAG: DUF2442 domain-containing protein [Paucibacter sp.]|nr:DUF2442 domain-containing protein [Roseateles sp.]